jgi:hypothetical protein
VEDVCSEFKLLRNKPNFVIVGAKEFHDLLRYLVKNNMGRANRTNEEILP